MAVKRLLTTLQSKLMYHGNKKRTDTDILDIQALLEQFENGLRAHKHSVRCELEHLASEVSGLQQHLPERLKPRRVVYSNVYDNVDQ